MRSDPVSTTGESAPLGTTRVNGTPSQDLWQLRQIEWLRDLPGAELAALQRCATLERVATGGVVFSPSASPRSIRVLASGLVRVYRLSESGAETSLGYVAPGEAFGELAAFGAFPRESFAEAVRPSAVWRLSLEAFRRTLERNPALALPIARCMAARLQRIETRVEDLVHRPVRNRVARILTDLARDFGCKEGGGLAIDVPITQSELATLIGATRQTVNQTLGELTQLGLVARDRRRLVLLSPDRLAELVTAAPEPA